MGKVVLTVSIDTEAYKKAQRLGFNGVYSVVLETALEVLSERVGEDFVELTRQRKREVIRDILVGGGSIAGTSNGKAEKGIKKENVEVNKLVLDEYNNLW